MIIQSLIMLFGSSIYQINFSNFKFLLKESKLLICSQPTGIFFGIILNLLGKKNIFYIIDTHPSSLPFHKSLFYRLILFYLFLFISHKRVLTPNGQLINKFPFYFFIKVDWFDFVSPKFIENKWNPDNTTICYLFYGTLSKKKGYLSFEKLFFNHCIKCNFSISKIGYVNKESLFYSDSISRNLDTKINNYVLVWCSIYESYGLVFREFCLSGIPVIFNRCKLENDNILNSIYIKNVKIDSSITNLFLYLFKNYKQENVKNN